MRAPVLRSSHWSRIFHDMRPADTTPTAAHSSPSPSLPHPSLHSLLHPYALPLERCFIPHQLPFIPLQPFGLFIISSFHK